MSKSIDIAYLYHYTSQQGLLGILDIGSDKLGANISQTGLLGTLDSISNKPKPRLWMTNILFLNDSSESKHTFNIVKSVLRKRIKVNKLPYIGYNKKNMTVNQKLSRTYEKIEEFCHKFHDSTEFESYIYSLSRRENDLNQYRGSCPKEGGFCIEFDYKILSSLLKRKDELQRFRIRIEPCSYLHRKQIREITSLFDELDTSFKSNEKAELPNIAISFFVQIIELSSYYKDSSFIDEAEYRIISQGIHNHKMYRTGKSMIIPYVELSLVDDVIPLPITKIFVGPTPHPELSKLSIESLLESNGYKIEVEPSNIPYRSL